MWHVLCPQVLLRSKRTAASIFKGRGGRKSLRSCSSLPRRQVTRPESASSMSLQLQCSIFYCLFFCFCSCFCFCFFFLLLLSFFVLFCFCSFPSSSRCFSFPSLNSSSPSLISSCIKLRQGLTRFHIARCVPKFEQNWDKILITQKRKNTNLQRPPCSCAALSFAASSLSLSDKVRFHCTDDLSQGLPFKHKTTKKQSLGDVNYFHWDKPALNDQCFVANSSRPKQSQQVRS